MRDDEIQSNLRIKIGLQLIYHEVMQGMFVKLKKDINQLLALNAVDTHDFNPE